VKHVRSWSARYALLAVIVAAAMFLSYRAWYAVGIAAGLGKVGGATIALLVDVFAIYAAGTLTGNNPLKGRARLYPWSLLFAFGAMSVWGNILHAQPVPGLTVQLEMWQAAVICAIPPMAAFLGFHLLTMVAEVDARAKARAARVSPAAGTAGAVTSPPSRRIGPTTRMPQARSAGTRSPRRDEAWVWLEEHHGARAVDLQQALGVTQSTASRWVRQWHEQGPRLAAVNQ